jgi:hypothetical protein
LSYHVRHVIGTPVQAHGVANEAAYLEHARRFLLRHGMPAALVKEVGLGLAAYVSGGWWVVKCPCGNAPAAHPGDGTDAWPRPIAICLECGSVYRPAFPRDWKAAEATLLERPDPATRHYFPGKDEAAWVGEDRGQTVAYLRRENEKNAAAIAQDRARLLPRDGGPADAGRDPLVWGEPR